jgi:RimJ/RimL family protein N-acetyltransferase
VSVSVDESVRGRGYGTEMLRVSAAEIFAETNVNAIHAFIKPDNVGSLRAFARCGYRRVGSLSLHEQPATHWVLERDR